MMKLGWREYDSQEMFFFFFWIQDSWDRKCVFRVLNIICIGVGIKANVYKSQTIFITFIICEIFCVPL